MAIGVLAIGVLVPYSLGFFGEAQAKPTVIDPVKLPATAQIIDQRSFNVLEHVPPPKEANATTVSEHKHVCGLC
jgi:gluconolactonase